MTTYFYFQNLKLGLHKKTEIFLSGDLLLARDRSYPWSRPSPRPILVTILEESEKKLGLGQKTKKKSIIYSKTKWETGTYGPNHLLY